MNVQPAATAIDTPVTSVDDRNRRWSALMIMAFGVFILWGAAYANTSQLHNSAHDSRHALGFPCH